MHLLEVMLLNPHSCKQGEDSQWSEECVGNARRNRTQLKYTQVPELRLHREETMQKELSADSTLTSAEL